MTFWYCDICDNKDDCDCYRKVVACPYMKTD